MRKDAQKNLKVIIDDCEINARKVLSGRCHNSIQTAIDRGEAEKADDLIGKFITSFGPDYQPDKIKEYSSIISAIITEEKDRQRLLEESPLILKVAIELLKQNKLSDALRKFETLKDSPDVATQESASAYAASLTTQKVEFDTAFLNCQMLLKNNLQQAEKEIGLVRPASGHWGQSIKWKELNRLLTQTITDAENEFDRIKGGSNQSAFSAYMDKYPGSRGSGKIRDLLNNLRNELAAIEKAMVKIKQYTRDKNWRLLHQHWGI